MFPRRGQGRAMSESNTPSGTSGQRIDDTPGAAGSVTEASDPAGERNPAERAVGPDESLPGSGDRAPRPSAESGAPSGDVEGRDEGGGGTGVWDKSKADRDEDERRSGASGAPSGSYVDEFRPEPVQQVPSKGRVGQGVGGAQVVPDTDTERHPQNGPE